MATITANKSLSATDISCQGVAEVSSLYIINFGRFALPPALPRDLSYYSRPLPENRTCVAKCHKKLRRVLHTASLPFEDLSIGFGFANQRLVSNLRIVITLPQYEIR